MIRLAALLFLGLLWAAMPAAADDSRLDLWSRVLERADLAIADMADEDGVGLTWRDRVARLEAWRTRLREIAVDARDVATEAEGELTVVNELLGALGPPPGAEDPPEQPGTASERARLIERQQAVKETLGEARLIATRAGIQVDRIMHLERRLFGRQLFSRLPVADSLLEWQRTLNEYLLFLETTGAAFDRWWAERNRQGELLTMALRAATALVVLLAIAWGLQRLLRRFRLNPDLAEPTYRRRLLAALADGISNGVLPAAAAVAVVLLVDLSPFVTGVTERFAMALGTHLGALALILALTHAVLRPGAPAWRLIDMTDDGARKLWRRLGVWLGVLVIINVSTVMFETFARPEGAMPPLTDADLRLFAGTYGFATLTVVVLASLPLLDWRIWRPGPGGGIGVSRLMRRICVILLPIVVVMPVLAALGFVYLTETMASYLVIGGLSAILALMLRALVHELIVEISHGDLPPGPWLRTRLGLDDDSAGYMRFWTQLLLDIVLGAGTVLLVLVALAGLDSEDLAVLIDPLFAGIAIGEMSFSVVDVLAALVVFLIAMTVVRTIQRVLGERLLVRTRLDPGVRDAITTGVGYLGLILGSLLAVTVVGLDLTNLALIAGALSVGIGFGLQNIVNNFVSGIILILERPVKSGDWIIVGTTQGYVKKVHIRATELVTFQKDTVFVPNSEIVATQLVNRTHKTPLGRLDIALTVTYDTDAEALRELLVDIATSHPNVAEIPAPFVVLSDFADHGLRFMLYVYLRDVNTSFASQHQLRMTILAALRERGIRFALPQRVLHGAPPPEPTLAPGET